MRTGPPGVVLWFVGVGIEGARKEKRRGGCIGREEGEEEGGGARRRGHNTEDGETNDGVHVCKPHPRGKCGKIRVPID